uniref:DSL domain-containing protein n=1 Tax=Macrostomum lignano TaxID=282301 RepID=A0A1I8FXK2_9PLAT
MDTRHLIAIWLTAFLSFQPLASSSAASGAVHVKFDSYRQRDRGSCDRSFFGSDHCDPYFLISVSTPRKILATFVSSEYENAPTVIHFGDFIGQLINPLEFHFTGSDLKPTDNVQVSVTVKDKDPGEHELMCRLHRSYNAAELPFFANNSANSRWSSHLTEISSNGHILKLAVWIGCRPNFYQAACSVHCDPSRFGCSPNGSAICPAGYTALNGSCAPSDKCLRQGQAFCQNGGSCSEDLQGRPVSLVLMITIVLMLCIMIAVIVGFILYLKKSTLRHPLTRTVNYPLDDREQNG